VVFTLAIAFATSRAQLLVGALIGLAGALTFAVLVYRLGHRINLARFFAVAGSLLMLFAAGLLVDAVENLQQLGWLPVLRQTLWSSGHVLTEGSTLGDLLHTFFGYSQSPTVLQLLTYVCYVGVALAFFLRRPRRRVQQPATT
jgi:high-affinity iron transporter